MRPVRLPDGERGASIVEFALILPLFVLLTLGVVDIGRAFMVSNQMRGAAREAAAFAQDHPGALVPGDDCLDPENAQWKARNERGAGDAMVEFSVPAVCDLSGSPPDRISVTVWRDLDILTPFVGQFVGDGTTMRVSGRVEVVVQGV